MDTVMFGLRLLGLFAMVVIVICGYKESQMNRIALEEQADLIADLLEERAEMQRTIDQLNAELYDYGVRDN